MAAARHRFGTNIRNSIDSENFRKAARSVGADLRYWVSMGTVATVDTETGEFNPKDSGAIYNASDGIDIIGTIWRPLPQGAQLSTLRDREGRELLWDGDPAVWTGRAPLLFPIVGVLVGGVDEGLHLLRESRRVGAVPRVDAQAGREARRFRPPIIHHGFRTHDEAGQRFVAGLFAHEHHTRRERSLPRHDLRPLACGPAPGAASPA